MITYPYDSDLLPSALPSQRPQRSFQPKHTPTCHQIQAETPVEHLDPAPHPRASRRALLPHDSPEAFEQAAVGSVADLDARLDTACMVGRERKWRSGLNLESSTSRLERKGHEQRGNRENGFQRPVRHGRRHEGDVERLLDDQRRRDRNERSNGNVPKRRPKEGRVKVRCQPTAFVPDDRLEGRPRI